MSATMIFSPSYEVFDEDDERAGQWVRVRYVRCSACHESFPDTEDNISEHNDLPHCESCGDLISEHEELCAVSADETPPGRSIVERYHVEVGCCSGIQCCAWESWCCICKGDVCEDAKARAATWYGKLVGALS